MFENPGFIFWPVGTGDSTTIVVDEDTIFQLDIRHLSKSEDDEDDHAAIVDKLEESLPQKDGKPYLAAFALTHPDKDHVQGFAELLERVEIGELWFTPRVFREHEDDFCDDAVAFREEAHRRVTETIKAGGDPGAGNRVRLIGYDELLEEEHYTGFPKEFFTTPGNLVTMLDGEDRTGKFQAFIHGPFKDDSVGDRNDTSLAMQVVLGDDASIGGVLLFGDLKYPTIRKIFDVTKQHGNDQYLSWQVLLAPHHCSKSVMYQEEDGKTVRKQDILDDINDAQVGDGYIVSSSEKVPSLDSDGANPPHAKAKARYEEIAKGGFICTQEDGEAGEPLIFSAGEDGDIAYALDAISDGENSLAAAVKAARGSNDPPSQKVGFGEF